MWWKLVPPTISEKSCLLSLTLVSSAPSSAWHREHIPTYLAHKPGDSGKYLPMYRTDPSMKNYLAQMWWLRNPVLSLHSNATAPASDLESKVSFWGSLVTIISITTINKDLLSLDMQTQTPVVLNFFPLNRWQWFGTQRRPMWILSLGLGDYAGYHHCFHRKALCW